VNKEADRGLECRDYELSDGEDKVVYRIDLAKVGRAETLVHLIEKEYKDIETFSEEEHEFRKIKGIIAKFIYEDKVFYIAKGLAAGSALKGKYSWGLSGEKGFEPLSEDIAIRMPEDNQVAIVEGTIVIFNQGKFEKLFQYDYKSQVISEEKSRQIMEAYGVVMPEGLTLNALLEDRKPLLKKLQEIEIGEMSSKQVIDYAEEMSLELMSDENGKIIIMDDKDLTCFVNLLAEDYFVSPVNGRRYEIKSKKLLAEPEGEPPRG